ncbi:Protein of unknown function [Clostridium cavendishii DSM 21758]|uniref:DUF1292 domain-containing protein n=1 Tax=Clostridium cavendishii DSM 21758 TaxID=1121302 RepID=A0A1M6B687_9CLOT|nr:DUF1292 domain-containing protein [Clostridium cavendishii]SHI44251.1 Protein of unknown function [Clostridium cavendishii DSM 21758]
MSDKELNKCGCGCGCGEEIKEESCGCGCGDHSHEHEHNHEGCGCGCEGEHESYVVDLEDENGNIISCEVVDSFEYKEQDYVLVQNPEDGSVYLFKSINEEGELVVPEEAEFDEVTKYYQEELAN